MTDLISPKWRSRAGLIITFLAAVLAVAVEWQDMGPVFVLWTRRALALLVIVSNVFGLGITMPKVKLPPGAAAGTVAIIALALGLMIAAGCKVPPLTTAYRSHALLVTARDASGEIIEREKRKEMEACESKFVAGTEGWKRKLLDCYTGINQPLSAWVKHIRPAITATAATYWLALESAYVLKDSSLDTGSKVVQLACSALQALQGTLDEYAEQLGKLRGAIMAAVAGGELLVCR